MNRTEMLNVAESVLRNAGFQVSKKCCVRPSCFCLAARKHAQVALIKVPSDLGNISRRDVFELKTISSWFRAAPLFIGDRTREKPLEDDTVYTRYNIYAVTPKTLEDVVSRRMQPLIEAGPGGFSVRLDGEALRERRQKLGLSVGKLAELMRISRRTLYGYERGMAKASVPAAYNLEWALGIPVVKPINIFQPVPPSTGFFATAKRAIVKNRFLQVVLKKLSQCHFNVTPIRRAPFDFIAQSEEGQVNILGGISYRGEKDLDLRTKEILSISEIVKAKPLFVTDGKRVPYDIPLIDSQELDALRLPEDLFTRF